MKKMALKSLAVVFVLGVGFHAYQVKADEGDQKVVVLFNSGTKTTTKTNTIQNVGGQVDTTLKTVSAVTATVPADKVDDLENNPNVKAVSIGEPIKMLDQSQDWGINAIQAPLAWNAGITGKGVKVAVIDSGVGPNNEIPVAGGACFATDDCTNGYADDEGHGTHVAGIIAAANNTSGYVGGAYDVQIYSVKVMDSTGSGDTTALANALDWAITNHMDIINMSLGFPDDDPAISQLVTEASNNGILVVAAAGNGFQESGSSYDYNGGCNNSLSNDCVEYPARYDSVIAVGAVDSNNGHAYFSSVGPKVEVVAPGVNVTSEYLNNGFQTMSGTSMATPYVTAELALMKQAYPTYSAAELRQMLDENALDLGTAGRDNEYGYGLVQSFVGSNNQIETSIDKLLFTNESDKEYTSPSTYSTPIRTDYPTAFEVDIQKGNWYHVKNANTWINPTNYNLVDFDQTVKTITTLSYSYLKNGPADNQGIYYGFAPQPITIDGSYNGWFRYGTHWFYSNNYVDQALSYQPTNYQSNGAFYAYDTPDYSILNRGYLITQGQMVTVNMVYNGWAYLSNYKWIPLAVLQQPYTPTNYQATGTFYTYNYSDYTSLNRGVMLTQGQTVTVKMVYNGWAMLSDNMYDKWIPLSVLQQPYTPTNYRANGTFYPYNTSNYSYQNRGVLINQGQTVTVKMVYNGWAMLNTNQWLPLSVLTQTTISSTPTSNTTYYTVVNGDTLYSIATKFGVSVTYIEQQNNLTTSSIYVGEKLIIK